MSTITEDVGYYDNRCCDGNTSRNHPPSVKPPEDTTAVKTSRLYLLFSPSNRKIIRLLTPFGACRTPTGFKTER
ncbi:hypothetical protein DPMN_047129 [Dreissena polymorpha]|uniref:Uncharacterized protein n=1 Tax=Dreissena polymorpha TaxID=45954 RepID=A0A9D4I179_DREPO|nr:hypothetical protein DPMN_047129 [Dreissena polymorpha]